MLAFVNDAVSKELCAAACTGTPQCNAFEWYPNTAGYIGYKCHLYTGNASYSHGGDSLRRPTQGGGNVSGDAECYICGVTTECKECTPGTYQNASGATACEGPPCAAGTYGMSNATSAADAVCFNCEWGKVALTGSTTCNICPAGKYSTASAAPSAATCSDCPAYSYSDAGSMDEANCSCGRGYTVIVEGGGCVACAAGSFKDVNGSAECTDCPAGKYSTASAAPSASTCNDCPAYSYSDAGSTDKANCSCGRGYTVIVEGRMRCLRCRELQGREWIGGVHAVSGRDIRHSLSSDVCVHV